MRFLSKRVMSGGMVYLDKVSGI